MANQIKYIRPAAKQAAAPDEDSFDNVFLPLPPLGGMESAELEIYARFMRHVRTVPTKKMETRILSAIQFTADILDMNDAYVSKTLADMGLRAPRRAFPEAYLTHVSEALTRANWEVGGPSASTVDMKRFWDDIGDVEPASRKEASRQDASIRLS